MTKTIPEAVCEVCLWFPQSEEHLTHGAPDFKVQGKSFAMLSINLHGNGQVALWVRSPEGVQRLYTEVNPEIYFVPPYLGSRGWLGIDLNKGLGWDEIAKRVREAYENAAPVSLTSGLGETIRIDPPDVEMSPEEIDPMLGERAQEVLKQLAEYCRRLPETSEARQFGNPVWKAGKKTFVCAAFLENRLQLQFWVGVEQQGLFVSDSRFSIPAYMGHNGWMNIDVQDHLNWDEVESLIEGSYRHFALKRMLKVLDEN